MLVYRCGIDLSSSTLRFLAGHLRSRHRRQGTRWRRLPPGRQVLVVLAHLRMGDTYAQLAAGFGIGTATAYRYIREAIEVLAALAPTLQQAMSEARRKTFLILDGALLPIDRIAEDRPYYSGKPKRHGMNVQVNADPLSVGTCARAFGTKCVHEHACLSELPVRPEMRVADWPVTDRNVRREPSVWKPSGVSRRGS